MWKSIDASGRLRDRDLELNEGYPSRAEVTLMDSNHKPLFKPVVLEIPGYRRGRLREREKQR
jgi:hypothetical protein